MAKKSFVGVVLIVVLMAVNGSTQNTSEENHSILFKSKTIDTTKESPKTRLNGIQLSSKKVYLLIQFKGAVEESSKEEVQKLGGEFLNYIPNHAFVIRISENRSPLLWNIKSIRWIGDYEPELKIDPVLLQNDAVNEKQMIELHVKLFKGEDHQSFTQWIKTQNGTVLYAKRYMVKVIVPRKLIKLISSVEGVEWIEEAKKPQLLNYLDDTPPDPYETLTGYENGVKLLNPDTAYSAGLVGEGQVVGVADTGLDQGEEAEMSLDFKDKVLKAYALGFFSNSWADTMGHGTHVMGLILGTGAYSRGLLRGVSFGSQVVVQSLMSEWGGLSVPPDLSDLFKPAYDDGARIHSNSWGHPAVGYDQTARTLDEFMWETPDMLVVVAAGNDGVDADKDGVIDIQNLLSPGTAKNCLTVGASENLVTIGGIQRVWSKLRDGETKWGVEPIASDLPSDHENGIAAFSSRGPTADGRLKPDIVAPGTNILSARSHHPKAEKMWGEFNENYVWAGGTSMATPLTAGAASLVRQYFVSTRHMSPSAALIKATLINGADDLYPGQFGDIDKKEIPTHRPNVQEGWGRVNISESILSSRHKTYYIDEPLGIKKGLVKEYPVKVIDSTQPLRVTLAYTDAPASTAAKTALVNDIDLEVTSVVGKKYLPRVNGIESADHINNVEGIDISLPAEGKYVVRVKGFNIPQGKNGAQPYAVVVSGGVE